ncbi:MAG: Sialidase [Verrucomicrobiales bacterium]|nr:Sialidase [Verrucomicrobiales bacterium]
MLKCRLALVLFSVVATLHGAPKPVDVFVSGKDGYFGYRIPCIETAADGSLLAFAEARKNKMSDPGEPGQEVHLVMKRSTDGGTTWSAMKLIENAGPLWSAGNPVSILDRDTKRICLLYLRSKPERSAVHTARPGTDDIQLALRWSDDNGVSWSDRIDFTDISRDLSSTNWKCTVVGPAGGIQDRKGRLLTSAWKVFPWQNLAIFSEDHGKTWQRSGFVPGNEISDESQLVELADGRILMDTRQGGKGTHRWFSASSDGGKTWSKRRPGLEAPPVCCAIKRWTLKSAGNDKNRILWVGPKGPDRTHLIARVSYDECDTFGPEHMLYEGSAAYSSITVSKEHVAGVLFERNNYGLISFIKLEPKDLD